MPHLKNLTPIQQARLKRDMANLKKIHAQKQQEKIQNAVKAHMARESVA